MVLKIQKITVGNYELGLELKQIDFSNIKDGNCLFNVIINKYVNLIYPL